MCCCAHMPMEAGSMSCTLFNPFSPLLSLMHAHVEVRRQLECWSLPLTLFRQGLFVSPVSHRSADRILQVADAYSFCRGAGDLNSSPYACVISIFPAEQSPSSSIFPSSFPPPSSLSHSFYEFSFSTGSPIAPSGIELAM